MVNTDCLIQAVGIGNLHTTRKLLEGNEDIDIEAKYDGYEQTLLHFACEYGQLEIVKYLIQAKNANVNSVDCDGWTPLYHLCVFVHGKTEEESAKVAEFLLMNGADVNSRTNTDCTPLHQACSWGRNTALIQVLLNHGANINSADNDGDTPLYNACNSYPPKIDFIEFLLANNADRHTKNRLGRRPQDALRDRGHTEVLFDSYDKWPLAVGHKIMLGAPIKNAVFTGGVMVGLNPCLSQHQHALAVKTILLVRQLPVHEVALEILGFLTPAAVETIFLSPTV